MCSAMRRSFWFLGLAFSSSVAFGQISLGTTDASDGAVNIQNATLTLEPSLAPTGSWTDPAPIPGRGIYDPSLWAVVYKFSSMTLGSIGATGSINFGNPHPSGCPVVILSQGDINFFGGSLSVNQRCGGFPGGFIAVGAGQGSAGIGWGGGQPASSTLIRGGHGSHATAGTASPTRSPAGDIFGNPQILPLVGGAGGGGYAAGVGTNGGGAVMVASRTTIRFGNSTNNFSIFADGAGGPTNAGYGSGGAIRIIANEIQYNTPNGGLFARGQAGGIDGTLAGKGRIRLEANTFGGSNVINFDPAPSLAAPGLVAKLWPTSTDPKVTVTRVNNIVVNPPNYRYMEVPDVLVPVIGNLPIEVECLNVPTNGTWAVEVKVTPRSGPSTVHAASFLAGNQALSAWSVSAPIGDGFQTVQARAYKL